jgi:hypothetical protein
VAWEKTRREERTGISDEAVKTKTGKTWAQWFALLEGGRSHGVEWRRQQSGGAILR